MMAIDPSTRSAGWAYFEAGELKDSGTVKLSDKYPMHQRLPMLYDQISLLPKADLLVVEKLTGSMVHPYLHMGTGTAVASVRAPDLILVPIIFWKAVSLVATNYTKTDQKDAETIGQTVVERARELAGLVETYTAEPSKAS